MLVPNWSLMDVSLSPPHAGLLPEWQELTTRALAPSGHNAPELVIPVVNRHARARLATVRDAEGLQLALPLVRNRRPLGYHASLVTPVNFHSLPHVGRAMAVPALTALFRKIGAPILLQSVPVDGAFWQALTASSAHTAVLAEWQRAALAPQGTYENWFEQNFERKRRKEYRRLAARLGEQGALDCASYEPRSDAGVWTTQFLDLEARGWKGRRGTALKSDAAATAALREGLDALAGTGKLRFWKLALDGKAIAMLYAIVESGHAWLGKIAHDEDFARYSPGVQLILHATEALFRENIKHADSCAIPGHPMIDNVWRDRLRVADVLLAGPQVPTLLFNATVAAERLRRSARNAARDAYYRLSGRHRS